MLGVSPPSIKNQMALVAASAHGLVLTLHAYHMHATTACGTTSLSFLHTVPHASRHPRRLPCLPAGNWLISLAIGRDCTALFESYHLRPEVAVAHLRRLPVLEGFPVEAVPRSPYPNDSQLYNTIRCVVCLLTTRTCSGGVGSKASHAIGMQSVARTSMFGDGFKGCTSCVPGLLHAGLE